jgi:hypothetical protein
MFKILIFLIIIIFGVYFIDNVFKLNLFSKSEIVNIKTDDLNYKSIPANKGGLNFVGDSLKIYNVTREKILPRVIIEDKNGDIEDKKSIPIVKQKIKIKENIINNLYLQIASYKNIEKAKQLISSYKESSNLILSKLDFNIVTANISDRGTYYRVRVGPYKDIKDIYKLCLDFKVKDNECLIVKDKK